MASIENIPGIGPATRAGLAEIGVTSTSELAASDVANLTRVRGISAARAEAFIAMANEMASGEDSAAATEPKKSKPKKKADKKKKTDKVKASAKEAKVTKTKKAEKSKTKKAKKSKK